MARLEGRDTPPTSAEKIARQRLTNLTDFITKDHVFEAHALIHRGGELVGFVGIHNSCLQSAESKDALVAKLRDQVVNLQATEVWLFFDVWIKTQDPSLPVPDSIQDDPDRESALLAVVCTPMDNGVAWRRYEGDDVEKGNFVGEVESGSGTNHRFSSLVPPLWN